MIAARATRVGAPALVTVVGGAAVVRSVTGGASPAASPSAALLFSALLLLAALLGGMRPSWIPWRAVGIGVAGAAALVALSLVGVPTVVIGARAAAGSLLWWMPLVSLVAAAEELVLRGVLFDAVRERGGVAAAVGVTAVLFAVIHLPLYGFGSLALDVCVGVLLGCLRVISGTVAAPLIAHVLADLATGWVG